jgi:hypothetical protein
MQHLDAAIGHVVVGKGLLNCRSQTVFILEQRTIKRAGSLERSLFMSRLCNLQSAASTLRLEL